VGDEIKEIEDVKEVKEQKELCWAGAE